MAPLVKLEPLDFESSEDEHEFEDSASGHTKEPAEEPAGEPAMELDGQPAEDTVAQSALPQKVILGLLDMLEPAIETRKRNFSAATVDPRGWKRYKGDPFQLGLAQTSASIPPNPVAGSYSAAITIVDDDDDDDDEDEPDFVTANSGSTTLGSGQPTGEEEDQHVATTNRAQWALNSSVRHITSDLGLPQAGGMATPPESNLHQGHSSLSRPSHSPASATSAVSALTHAPSNLSHTHNMMDGTAKPVDHREYPLSDAAMEVARQYWESLRQFERCPFGSSNGSMPSVDLLVRIAQHRQKYTELVLGLGQVVPGTRTFEPPYIAPVNATSSPDSTLSQYDVYSSMHDGQVAGTNPRNNPSQAPGYGNASASFQGNSVYNDARNNSQFNTPHKGNSPSGFNTPNNRGSPSHKSSPYNHSHNTHTQSSVISSAYHTDIPNPPSASHTSGVVDVDAGPVSDMMPIEPALNEEQQKVVELAAAGHNIFYTGSAGSGKSTVLHAIKKRLEGMGKKVRVMAPTGKVALAINGTTTWTFAGWTPDSYRRGIEYLKKAAQGRTVRKRLRETDVIIIDEISMVDNLHLERLNQVMQAGRAGMKNSDELPFGGVQVIATGDFFQLPPITPFQVCLCGNTFTKRTVNSDTIHTCSKCYTSFVDNEKWAFKSRAWEDCGFVHIQLSTIHRQRDPEFIGMLQKCRKGVKFTPREVDLLMKHPSVTPYAVKLFSTRDEVRRTNEEAFRALHQPPHSYRCYDKFDGSAKHPHLNYKGRMTADGTLAALADHRFDHIVELKQGMPVVLLVNDLATGLANGSQGIITGFEPHDASRLPLHVGHGERTVGGQLTTYAGIKNVHTRAHAQQQWQGLAWPIVKFFCGITRTIYPVCHVVEIGDEAPYSLLCRTQVPLTAGYAMSIHRSQGLTLDRVIVDLSHVFEDGQVYVALSRATGLKGLKIEGDPRGLIVGNGNKEVRTFMKEKFDM